MIRLEENMLFAGRYKLLKLLGRGASSEVWMAGDDLASITVALKIYAPGMGLDEDGMQLFSKEEFARVFNMNHPCLLRPTHYDVVNRMPYLVMPYCENGSCIGLIGKMSEPEAWRFLHDVASGLAYLHGRESSVIHQDIKPDNVLIDENGSFLITDFGISTKIRSTMHKNPEQEESMFGGTIAYTGPERFGRNNRPVKASDIWALGASAYELLEGTAPFGYDFGGNLQKNGAEIPEMEGDWSPELKQIIERCLAKETWDRPTANEIVELTEKHSAREREESKNGAKVVNTIDETDEKMQNVTSDSFIARIGQTIQKYKIPHIAVFALILLLAGFLTYRFAGMRKDNTVSAPVFPEPVIISPDTTVVTVNNQSEEKKPEVNIKEEIQVEKSGKEKQEAEYDYYLGKGNYNYIQGNYEAAIENYDKCIKLSSSPLGAKGPEKRIKDSEKCLPIRKNADALFEQQKYAEAENEYRRILSINENDKHAKERLEECNKQL
ncbi:MAG: serine/threonine-protein kinase [Dysgonamonadaceae bacterium]|jgi:serine/threonine protein kinase|nr:serine/threonine-protein kinase [Dysgonamonadaceae bacterium]